MEMLELNDLHKTFNPGTVNEKDGPERCQPPHWKRATSPPSSAPTARANPPCSTPSPAASIADEGSITLDGQDITFAPEYKRSRVIGRLFQDPLKGTAPNMTIEENLALAYLRAGRHGSPSSPASRRRTRSCSANGWPCWTWAWRTG